MQYRFAPSMTGWGVSVAEHTTTHKVRTGRCSAVVLCHPEIPPEILQRICDGPEVPRTREVGWADQMPARGPRSRVETRAWLPRTLPPITARQSPARGLVERMSLTCDVWSDKVTTMQLSEGRTRTITTVYLDEDLREGLKVVKATVGIPEAEQIRRALRQWLAEHDAVAPTPKAKFSRAGRRKKGVNGTPACCEQSDAITHQPEIPG